MQAEGINEMKNRIQLNDIDGMQVGDIAKLHVAELAMLMEDADEMAKKAKTYKDWLSGAVAIKYEDSTKAAFKDAVKDCGTVHLTDDGFDIEVEAKKSISWDSGKLAAAFDAMAKDEADHYCKCKLEVDERKYVAAPPAIKALLEPARTMKVGKPTYKITQREV